MKVFVFCIVLIIMVSMILVLHQCQCVDFNSKNIMDDIFGTGTTITPTTTTAAVKMEHVEEEEEEEKVVITTTTKKEEFTTMKEEEATTNGTTPSSSINGTPQEKKKMKMKKKNFHDDDEEEDEEEQSQNQLLINNNNLEMIADKESTAKLIQKVLSSSNNITLPHPYINMGMPKIGSSSLHEFFECSGIVSTHWRCRKQKEVEVEVEVLENNNNNTTTMMTTQKTTQTISSVGFCGKYMEEAVEKKNVPPLEYIGYRYNETENIGINYGTGQQVKAAQAFTQLDYFSMDSNSCIMPQVSYLQEIHDENPYATFIWISRPYDDWNRSLSKWHQPIMNKTLIIAKNSYQNEDSKREQFTKCDLPGLPSGVGSDDQELLNWVVTVQRNLRQFVKDHPTHALIELDLYDPNNDIILTQLFGPKSKNCWGVKNKSWN